MLPADDCADSAPIMSVMRLCEMVPMSVMSALVGICEVEEGAFADVATELDGKDDDAVETMVAANDLVLTPWVPDVCDI